MEEQEHKNAQEVRFLARQYWRLQKHRNANRGSITGMFEDDGNKEIVEDAIYETFSEENSDMSLRSVVDKAYNDDNQKR